MSSTKPIIGISTNEIINFGGRQVSHSTGLRYVNAVSKFSNAIPILIPSYIKGKDLDLLLKKVDGIVLTGGRANVEPHHFGGDPFPPDEPIDVGRDEIVLEMIPKCVTLGIPIFGIPRYLWNSLGGNQPTLLENIIGRRGPSHGPCRAKGMVPASSRNICCYNI